MSKIDAPATPASKRVAATSPRRATSNASKATKATEATKVTKAANGSAARTVAAARRTVPAVMPQAPEPMPAAPEPAAPAKAAKAAPDESRAPAPRTQWVRQSCRLTTAEYGELSTLKKRAAALARPMKRGRLLRAGLHAMCGMSDAQLFALLDSMPQAEADSA